MSLTAKNIIEMDESIIHHPEARKRSTTMKIEKTDKNNVSLNNRRASVPMEIIIGADGRPVFNATSSPTTVGSPNLAEQRDKRTGARKATKELSTSVSRDNSKKRNKSVKKEKKLKAAEREKSTSEEKESPNSEEASKTLVNTMAQCSIVPLMNNNRRKSIDIGLPEYQIRRESVVFVRDVVSQTDFN